jgi:diguanylate cyclase
MAPLRIAVNVSPLQLQQNNFAEIVADVLAQHDEKDCMLDIEVTESLLMEDIEESINKLASVRELGVQVSIDDFGTGYSSLGYLTKLPVHALKIDRSFIMSMTSQPESMTIVSTIITLAHSLNLKVIAEGVETEEQAKLLQLLKCDEMQGYFFSKPMPLCRISSLELKC